MKEITLANSAGFCFGVKRAVDTALNIKEKYNNKVYTLGPLIHNNDVVDFLKENLIVLNLKFVEHIIKLSNKIE